MTWGSQPCCTLWIQINSPLALPLGAHSLELMILSWAYFFSWEFWWVITILFSLTIFKWFWFTSLDMKWKELWSSHALLSSSRSLVTDVLMLYLTHKSSLLVFLYSYMNLPKYYIFSKMYFFILLNIYESTYTEFLVNIVCFTLKLYSLTALVIQGLRLHTFNAGDLGSIPGWGTKTPTCHARYMRVGRDWGHTYTHIYGGGS